jgi:hypothetical protein
MHRFVVIRSSLSAVGHIVVAARRRHHIARRRVSQRRRMVNWLDLLPWNRRNSVVTQFNRARIAGNRSAAAVFSSSAHSLFSATVGALEAAAGQGKDQWEEKAGKEQKTLLTAAQMDDEHFRFAAKNFKNRRQSGRLTNFGNLCVCVCVLLFC